MAQFGRLESHFVTLERRLRFLDRLWWQISTINWWFGSVSLYLKVTFQLFVLAVALLPSRLIDLQVVLLVHVI